MNLEKNIHVHAQEPAITHMYMKIEQTSNAARLQGKKRRVCIKNAGKTGGLRAPQQPSRMESVDHGLSECGAVPACKCCQKEAMRPSVYDNHSRGR